MPAVSTAPRGPFTAAARREGREAGSGSRVTRSSLDNPPDLFEQYFFVKPAVYERRREASLPKESRKKRGETGCRYVRGLKGRIRAADSWESHFYQFTAWSRSHWPRVESVSPIREGAHTLLYILFAAAPVGFTAANGSRNVKRRNRSRDIRRGTFLVRSTLSTAGQCFSRKRKDPRRTLGFRGRLITPCARDERRVSLLRVFADFSGQMETKGNFASIYM